jgi:hypothetical protein
MQTRKAISILAVLLLSTCSLFAQNPHGQSALAVPVAGTTSLGTPPAGTTSGPLSSLAGGTFAGTFNITRFVVQSGQLTAIGNLVGTVTQTGGATTAVVLNDVAAQVTAASGTCPVLSLTLGPLHLDLLGLVVDLNQVNLDITAVPGSGNLLGNLLCSVAGLLNGGLTNLTGGALNQVVGLLNQILGAL